MSDAAYKEWRMNTHNAARAAAGVERMNAHNAAQAAAAAERRKIREAEEAERRKRRELAKIDAVIAGLRAKRAAIEACYEVAMSFVDNDGESQDNLR